MRTEAGVQGALILVGALAYGLALLAPWLWDLPYVALAGFTFVLTRRAVVHARDEEEQHEAAPETTLRLCAVGIAAWGVLLLLFASLRGRLPQPVASVLGLRMLADFALPLLLLCAAEFGFVAVGKAGSRGAKWIVAFVHFTPPLAYAALLRTA